MKESYNYSMAKSRKRTVKAEGTLQVDKCNMMPFTYRRKAYKRMFYFAYRYTHM